MQTAGSPDTLLRPQVTRLAPGEEPGGRLACTRTVRPKEPRDGASPRSPQPAPRAPATRADLASPPRGPSKRSRLGCPRPEGGWRKPRVSATPLPEPNMAAEASLPSRTPSLPGVKMAAPGGARKRRTQGAGPGLHAPQAQPPGGTLTRGLPIGSRSWRARIGPHGGGADLEGQSPREGWRGAGLQPAPPSIPGNGRRFGAGRRPEAGVLGRFPVDFGPRPRCRDSAAPCASARHEPAGPGRAGAAAVAVADRRGHQEADALQALPGAGRQVQPGGPVTPRGRRRGTGSPCHGPQLPYRGPAITLPWTGSPHHRLGHPAWTGSLYHGLGHPPWTGSPHRGLAHPPWTGSPPHGLGHPPWAGSPPVDWLTPHGLAHPTVDCGHPTSAWLTPPWTDVKQQG